MYRLPWTTGREHIAFKLREKELSNGVNLFDAFMNAAWIDKDAILIPQFVDGRATAVGVSSAVAPRVVMDVLGYSDIL